ncbi:hypothetical protein NDN08_008152 [Rhodosorus marinus]|uniref:Uncharacterized protein n=1 Tax=Rhodosorus marinus TaxID=101924 RepID=A0AAV8UZK1_9RHOD|nr:hypothetical protein NDN08_008152 [Rhodosorus marinus]
MVQNRHFTMSAFGIAGTRRYFHSSRSSEINVGKAIGELQHTLAKNRMTPDDGFRVQVELFYDLINKNIRFDLGHVVDYYSKIMESRGYNTFFKKRVVGFYTRTQEEYKDITSKFAIFDGMNPAQRLTYYKLKDRDIREIAKRADVDPKEVYKFVQEASSLFVSWKVLKTRRGKGLADVSTARELMFVQSSPNQCWPGPKYPMINPWERRKPAKQSKYAQ